MSACEIRPPAGMDVAECGAVPVAGSARELSLRSNFAWAVTGNTIYAICQWGMVVALAKFGSTLMVGQFSLGLAIVTPVLMLSNSLGSNLHMWDDQVAPFTRHFRLATRRRRLPATSLSAITSPAPSSRCSMRRTSRTWSCRRPTPTPCSGSC